MKSTLDKTNEFLMPNYGKIGLEIISGKGAYVSTKDAQGKRKRCRDWLGGFAVNSLGHCHPDVVAAIIKQSKKLMHVSNLYATSPMAELAAKLVELTEDKNAKVFFCNDGTGANEAAAKLARIWAYEKYGPEKNTVVALMDGFHGRTMFSISLTGQKKMQKKFAPGVPGVKFVNLNDIGSLHRVVNDDVCAIIFETIQGEGGVNIMDQGFYNEIETLSQKYNFLRIVDEVQSGIGRTGRMFSYQQYENISHHGPEIITLAKALGGGLPIGAVIAKGNIGQSMLFGSHAATFGGNPVSCAAALAVLKVIEEYDLLNFAKQQGEYLMNILADFAGIHKDKIKQVRGEGLMIGIQMEEPYQAGDVVKAMYEKSVLIGTAGPQVVRFLPPLIVTKDQIDQTLKKFEQVIKRL
jgi:acetylornithine/N-succinyldiaminopimelate aminotransferase